MRRTVGPGTGRPTRLHAVVGATVLAAVAVALLAARQAAGGVVSPRQLALLAVAIPASEMALLHVRGVGERWSFTWGEACLLVGFGLVGPGWFTLLAGPLVMGVHLAARRGLMKSAFNGASFAVSAGAADLVLTRLTDAPYVVTSLTAGLALL